MFSQNLYALAEQLLETCKSNKLRVTVAESCTGGLVSGLITSIPVASAIFGRGFLTYSNQAKGEMLGVPAHIFMLHGAVSEECAVAMAEGALENSEADVSIAVTGIAGPGGATETKPVGLVHIASARKGFDTQFEEYVFEGDRGQVRMQAVEVAIKLINKMAAL
jgi:nicotinamide-nucleotide amidase